MCSRCKGDQACYYYSFEWFLNDDRIFKQGAQGSGEESCYGKKMEDCKSFATAWNGEAGKSFRSKCGSAALGSDSDNGTASDKCKDKKTPKIQTTSDIDGVCAFKSSTGE